MTKLNCTREAAESFPLPIGRTVDDVLAILPDKPIPLSEKDLEMAQKVIKEFREGKRKPLKVIERFKSDPKKQN